MSGDQNQITKPDVLVRRASRAAACPRPRYGNHGIQVRPGRPFQNVQVACTVLYMTPVCIEPLMWSTAVNGPWLSLRVERIWTDKHTAAETATDMEAHRDARTVRVTWVIRSVLVDMDDGSEIKSHSEVEKLPMGRKTTPVGTQTTRMSKYRMGAFSPSTTGTRGLIYGRLS